MGEQAGRDGSVAIVPELAFDESDVLRRVFDVMDEVVEAGPLTQRVVHDLLNALVGLHARGLRQLVAALSTDGHAAVARVAAVRVLAQRRRVVDQPRAVGLPGPEAAAEA